MFLVSFSKVIKQSVSKKNKWKKSHRQRDIKTDEHNVALAEIFFRVTCMASGSIQPFGHLKIGGSAPFWGWEGSPSNTTSLVLSLHPYQMAS